MLGGRNKSVNIRNSIEVKLLSTRNFKNFMVTTKEKPTANTEKKSKNNDIKRHQKWEKTMQ